MQLLPGQLLETWTFFMSFSIMFYFSPKVMWNFACPNSGAVDRKSSGTVAPQRRIKRRSVRFGLPRGPRCSAIKSSLRVPLLQPSCCPNNEISQGEETSFFFLFRQKTGSRSRAQAHMGAQMNCLIKKHFTCVSEVAMEILCRHVEPCVMVWP